MLNSWDFNKLFIGEKIKFLLLLKTIKLRVQV